jgi:FkbM family methyltransferase
VVRELAKRADRLGLRTLLACLATAAFFYRGQWFSVDREGRWVNHYRGRKLASPSIFINPIPEVEQDAIDIFTYGYTPRAGDVVFDVGAGIGTETILFSRLVGATGRVVAIEAHPGTAAALRENVRGLGNVTVLEMAVMDRNEPVHIGETENHVANAIGSEGVVVEGRTIDSIAAELGIDEIAFVKMNIEGAERSAVMGLDGHPPRNLCISCHDFLPGEDTRTESFVRAVLKGRGYSLAAPRQDHRPWVPYYVYAHRDELAA